MEDQNLPNGATREPGLVNGASAPRGLLPKNIKLFVYAGVAVLLLTAAIISTKTKPAKAVQATGKATPQPTLQDNTSNNVDVLQRELADQRARAANVDQPASGVEEAADREESNRVEDEREMQERVAPKQPTAEEQAAAALATKEKERLYLARFSSNVAYVRNVEPAEPAAHASQGTSEQRQEPPNSYTNLLQQSLKAGGSAGNTHADAAPVASKRNPEVNVDRAVGQPFVIYEGLTMDAVLMNRLDGDAAGPVKALVSNPVYSHDRQHVLIPEGTIVLGEARKIGSSGFGQQRRLAVVFHRLLMPDGYSVDLDQFHGLDQIGEEGLKDKVDNHYLEIFGTSIALGIIAGAGEISEGGYGVSESGSQAFTNGATASVANSASTVLDRFLQIPPTITIREGHRLKVYFTQDLLLPAYENHRIAESF